MLQEFIKRPVLSTVISIIIVLLGLISLVTLPIQQYPDIAPPTVVVSASYPGANADVVINSVISPLETQINGVEGMTYMTSSAKNDGSATINIYFTLDTDPDMAAVNVQNRVASATSTLPADVVSMGVTTTKKQNSMVLALSISSDNPTHDETFLQNYARINVVPELQRIAGVGEVSVFGARDFSIRIWLEPDKMYTYNLQPSDVTAAIHEQSTEVAPGKVGADIKSGAFQYTIKYKGRLNEVEEYENIVLRVSESGEILRLKDIAKIELDAFNYDVVGTADGKPGVIMAIYQMKGSNSQEICNTIKAKMTELEPSFPSGMVYNYVQDSQSFLNASIHEVVKTLIEAFILVFLVVFIFLQNVKATIIPAISATVAIVGTFTFLSLLGYSINLLTLFALVLSIGIVVDDAIVVVEAVFAKLEGDPTLTPLKATQSAMSEITGAVISITLVFLATFLPVSFMSGGTGVFYQQFGITLAIAVCISAINALTLSPALCVLLIRANHTHNEESGKKSKLKQLGDGFNTGFNIMLDKYAGIVQKILNRKKAMMGIFILIVSASVFLLYRTPTAFVPTEDQGSIFYDVTMPEGAHLSRTTAVINQVDSILATIPEIDTRITVSGVGMLSGASGGAYGLGMIRLVDWEERDTTSLKEIYQKIYSTVNSSITKDATVIFFVPPTISGYGNSDAIEMQFKDQTGSGDLQALYKVGTEFKTALMNHPAIASATSSFSVNVPQYEMIVDINKCKLMNVAVSDVFNTMKTYFGGAVSGDFSRFTKYYRVMVQADAPFRKDATSLSGLFVRNQEGEMLPLSSVVELKRVFGSDLITKYNMFNSTTMYVSPSPGYSSGEAIAAIEEIAKTLPVGYNYEFSGMTRDQMEAGNQQILIFALSFILVFFILSALYESYIIPLSVMLSLLFGVFGVYSTINILGISANIYVQVALIMLLGLLAKNAILIVEFANMKREAGHSLTEAAILAAKDRLRPILMTSLAFIFGMIPLCLASGAGAAGNTSIGFSAAGGFLISTILGVFFVPTFFTIFKGLQEKISSK